MGTNLPPFLQPLPRLKAGDDLSTWNIGAGCKLAVRDMHENYLYVIIYICIMYIYVYIYTYIIVYQYTSIYIYMLNVK